MPTFSFPELLVGIIVLLTAALTTAQCDADRPLSLCCGNVALFSVDPEAWGDGPYGCGYSPSSIYETIGADCAPNPGNCSSFIVPACCTGLFSGPGEVCQLGRNCSETIITPAVLPPILPAPIPDGWTTDFACSSDTGARVIANDVTVQIALNSPATCIEQCTLGFYDYAGVEYGNECHCGTGYKSSPAPSSIDPSNCNMRCGGNDSFTCGGSNAIQLYHGPPPVQDFAEGWSQLFACAVDVPSRVLIDDVITISSGNTPGSCTFTCSEMGFPFGGVEYGDECHCGTGIQSGIEAAPVSDCDIPCPIVKGLSCGGSFRIQLYSYTKPATQ